MPKRTNTQRKERSTTFKPGNAHRFAPGASGNVLGVTGKRKERLISKALFAQLANKAPHRVALHFGLEGGASWGQCIAASLIHTAVRGDVAAIRTIAELTGDSAKLGPLPDPDALAAVPHVVVEFVPPTPRVIEGEVPE